MNLKIREKVISSGHTPVYSSKDISRRNFLKNTVLGSLGMSTILSDPLSGQAALLSNPSNTKRTPVVDTHIHCFGGPSDTRFPYHKMTSYIPETIATPEQLLICMNRAKVEYGIVVSPEPYQDDHRYLEYCLDVGKGRLKGTILVFCDRPGSMDQLPNLAKREDIIATRIHAYLPDRLPPFGKPELRQLWKLAADNGLAVQLNTESRYAGGFEPLIKEFRSVPVIIDHLGHPGRARSAAEYSIIERLGELPNTIIKLSNLGAIQKSPDPEMKFFVDKMIAAYSPDKMIWGGEFSNDPSPEIYVATLKYARSFVANYSKEDQGKIFGGTALHLFRKI